MIITNISIRYKNDINGNSYNFSELNNIFHSKKNATGKTTFLRGILFALGFLIPSTKKIDFAKYEFEISIRYENGITKKIKRFDKTITIGEAIYSYPEDFTEVISNVFQLQNSELILNLLGVLYIDQEKGWTLLNRGKIIGENGFNIESFLRGLNDNDVSDLKKQLNDVKNDIKKYQMLYSVVEYKNEVNIIENPTRISDYNEDILKELSVIDNKIKNLAAKIREIQSAKNNNSKFVDYVDSLGLRIKINGEEHVITKNELVGFKEYSKLSSMRINELVFEKNELTKRKKELNESIKEETLVNVNTVLEDFNQTINSFKIPVIQISKILDDLEKRKNEISLQIKTKTMENNDYVGKIKRNIEKYWNELNIEIPYSDNYLFTHDLKSLSGATLYKMIIAYKFSYISALQEKCGYNIPIFIDSPTGREVTNDTVSQVLNILLRDFSNNQIFICSIYRFDNIAKLKNAIILSFDLNKPFDRIPSLDLK